MRKYLSFLILILGGCLCGCNQSSTEKQVSLPIKTGQLHPEKPTLIILGNVQDAGSPHIGCKKSCCAALFDHPDPDRKVVALGVVDPENDKQYLFEATPDFAAQVKLLKQYSPGRETEIPDGIFLTHAHIGHYTGLMYLGKEAMNATAAQVYAMPRMYGFLTGHGPWSQLVNNRNIVLHELKDGIATSLTSNITVVPFLIPHRDEYSETVGYKIIGPDKTALFIPDIDKWNKWEKEIIQEIRQVDYAFVDATFYDGAEINNRNIAEIPHPFVRESMELLAELHPDEKKKVWFIHLNHTNPLLRPESEQTRQVLKQGFNIARFKDAFEL